VKVIWKFPLLKQIVQTVWMPEGAEILYVAQQGEWLCLWALVTQRNPGVKRHIQIVGTGQSPEEEATYIGTVVMRGDQFVWHVFENEGGEE
jgi:hypothetical protein